MDAPAEHAGAECIRSGDNHAAVPLRRLSGGNRRSGLCSRARRAEELVQRGALSIPLRAVGAEALARAARKKLAGKGAGHEPDFPAADAAEKNDGGDRP